MSLLLTRRISRLCLGKPFPTSSLLLSLSNGFSSTSLSQAPPCSVLAADSCGEGLGKLVVVDARDRKCLRLGKKVPLELVFNNRGDYATVTIGASHGWVATLNKEDGILRLQDDLNPNASYVDPKRIPLPPLVTLPRCQTQIITNVSMSTPSPEDEDCVVAVKFLGPQISFCRPAQSNCEWTNVRIQSPCFFNSRVMFSKKDNMFRIPGSGGHLIGSWDLDAHKQTIQRLRFQNKNLPKFTEAKRELLDSCCTSEHMVESDSTGETFLVRWYQKTAEVIDGISRMKTEALMVFKLDEEGNAVYAQDIGDLCIFLSKSEPFAVPAASFPGLFPNAVAIWDVDEMAYVILPCSSRCCSPFISHMTHIGGLPAPYYIPPQIPQNVVSKP